MTMKDWEKVGVNEWENEKKGEILQVLQFSPYNRRSWGVRVLYFDKLISEGKILKKGLLNTEAISFARRYLRNN